MGFRFRKSVKAGPFRFNLSKSGIGASVGVKGFRFTKKATGGTRTTLSVPGTGISYVKDYSSTSSKKSKRSSRNTFRTSSSNQENNTPNTNYERNKVVELLLCIFLGWMGAHRFYTHRKISAWVYLFTLGCFGIGWFGDIIIIASRFFPNMSTSVKQHIKPIAYALALLVFIIIGCSSESSDVPTDPATVVSTTVATSEPTTTPTTGETTEPTTVPTTEAATEPSTAATTEATAEPVVEEVTEHAIGVNTEGPEAATQAATEVSIETPTETHEEIYEAAPIETPTEAKAQGFMVWISKTGKKYHSSPDCSNMKNPSQITEERAIDKGLEPCSKCH